MIETKILLLILAAFSFVIGINTTIHILIDKKICLGTAIGSLLGIVGTIPTLIIASVIWVFNKMNAKVLWRW